MLFMGNISAIFEILKTEKRGVPTMNLSPLNVDNMITLL